MGALKNHAVPQMLACAGAIGHRSLTFYRSCYTETDPTPALVLVPVPNSQSYPMETACEIGIRIVFFVVCT